MASETAVSQAHAGLAALVLIRIRLDGVVKTQSASLPWGCGGLGYWTLFSPARAGGHDQLLKSTLRRPRAEQSSFLTADMGENKNQKTSKKPPKLQVWPDGGGVKHSA